MYAQASLFFLMYIKIVLMWVVNSKFAVFLILLPWQLRGTD